jgi:hypothetical protein
MLFGERCSSPVIHHEKRCAFQTRASMVDVETLLDFALAVRPLESWWW